MVMSRVWDEGWVRKGRQGGKEERMLSKNSPSIQSTSTAVSRCIPSESFQAIAWIILWAYLIIIPHCTIPKTVF